MSKFDYHMLVFWLVIAPHLWPWVAVITAVINVSFAIYWATRE